MGNNNATKVEDASQGKGRVGQFGRRRPALDFTNLSDLDAIGTAVDCEGYILSPSLISRQIGSSLQLADRFMVFIGQEGWSLAIGSLKLRWLHMTVGGMSAA